MPCHTDPDPDHVSIHFRSLTVITRLACDYCTALESSSLPIPSWARDWWDKHKIEDAAREEREKQLALKQELLNNARAKLTPDELAALGVRALE